MKERQKLSAEGVSGPVFSVFEVVTDCCICVLSNDLIQIKNVPLTTNHICMATYALKLGQPGKHYDYLGIHCTSRQSLEVGVRQPQVRAL